MIASIIVGLIAGALAKLIMPGKDPGGIFITIGIGIVGGIVGGYLADFAGIGGENGAIARIATATVGAIILLGIYRMLKKN